ncbi:MAG: TSUP family transporter [Lachnospiraceae bacterium]|nr:TSUP family transporter [Lachnospiraceae bacterium]
MNLNLQTFIIVCPLVFLAGIIDAIGGGGGLISLPAYIAAGIPPHFAVATNKMSATFGTALATGRFARQKLIDWKLAAPSVVCAFSGAVIGSNLSILTDEKIMTYLMYVILPVAAFLVLNPKLFKENAANKFILTPKTYVTVAVSSFIIGIYDGFYGPGTGTFLIIAFVVFARLPGVRANGLTKAINLTTNVSSLLVFLINAQVIVPLGLAAALCNMAGGYIGAGLAIKKGTGIIKPVTVIVLILLLLHIAGII